MAVPRVVLVDGTGLLYRAWFALPSTLCTSDGRPTNVIFGFAKMFRRILRDRRPTHGVVVFDAPGKTARHALDPLYKSGRPPMPDRLRAQLEGIDAIVAGHGFPSVRLPGVEADDVLATLCRQALEQGASVTLVTADKDLVPLLADDRVRLYDGTAEVLLDADRARRTYGVAPAQIRDWLALVGDRVDNVPGVRGIGKKQAASLLQTHGDLDGLLAAAPNLGPLGKTLLASRERLRLSQKLVTLDDQLELPLTWPDVELPNLTPEGLNAVYRRFELFSLLSPEPAPKRAFTYYVVDTPEMAAAALHDTCRGSEPVAIHVLCELDGDREVVGVALSPEPALAFWFPFRGPGKTLGVAGPEVLRVWLEDPDRRKVAHEVKHAYRALRGLGVELRGVVGDTALASYLLDPTRDLPHRIEQVARTTLKRGLQPLKVMVGSGRARKRFEQLTVDRAGAYANHLADAVGACWRVQRDRLEEEGLTDVLETVDLPLASLLADVERTGIGVDPAVVERLGSVFVDDRSAVAADIHALVGHPFRIGSTKQLGTVLFEELGLPVLQRTKTGYSTAAGVLEQLDHPIVPLIQRWRALDHLITAWTQVLVRSVSPVTGRIHATFQQTASASGRLITTDPDLQRAPVRDAERVQVREAFVAAEGFRLVAADWSQIELRVLAHLSADPVLLEAYQTGADLHRQTAAALFDVPSCEVTSAQRDVGKTVNFATVYGQGPTALAQQLGVSHRRAKGFIQTFFQTYRGVASWRDATVGRAHLDGFVRTMGGRVRFVPELSTKTHADRAYGERIAMNTPIQGSAADLCKDAMLRIEDRLRAEGLTGRLVLQVHDELVYEVPEEEVDRTVVVVREEMERTWTLAVPLVVEVGVGASWAATKTART